ncbi:MAG: transporter [Marivivens sp.]|nr:transporter [Marivivens sp.]
MDLNVVPLLGTTAAYAGGMDRSGQSITALFEEGTYAEISFGSVSPDVSGVYTLAPLASGNIAPDYTTFGLAFRTDLNDKVSLAFIMDQPFGANVDYSAAGYPLAGTSAEVTSSSITLLGQYQINENTSVYAGPRIVSVEGQYRAAKLGVEAYSASYEKSSEMGYVVGAAYEIPEIALRAAVTYSSEMNFTLDGSGNGAASIPGVGAVPPGTAVGNLTATTPQSVNLDFQTGVAANTLAIASIRWADWSEATIDDSVAGNLTDFGNKDTYTYTIGLGRKFSDNFSGLISVGYEKAAGDYTGNLSPTDGYTSLSLGGAYTFDNGMELSGGIRRVWVGDATSYSPVSTTTPAPGNLTTPFGNFSDNSATAIGLKLAYNY